MRHLDPERLAALHDEAATVEEAAHLARCAVCSQERDAFAQLRAVAAMPTSSQESPLTNWATLAPALQAEGLLVPVSAPSPTLSSLSSPAHTRRVPGWLRVAAMLALVAGSVAVGRVSAGGSLLPTAATVAVLQDNGIDSDFESVAAASTVLERAQRDYERASLWLASHDTTVNAQAVYKARLAALDQMMLASRAGLYAAPQDPLLNQYYLAAYTAREATLRQLGASLSVDRVMERF